MVAGDVEGEAETIVEVAIDSAVEDVKSEKRNNLKNIWIQNYENDLKDVEDIEWSACKDFTEEVGLTQIEKYITTWVRDSAWLHCIDFIGKEELDYDFKYNYRVRWSIPTRRKPIPRATACVYFTIQVSKIKPDTLPVQVSFVFEGNRLVHKPGKSIFQEVWLKNIVESKIHAMQPITF